MIKRRSLKDEVLKSLKSLILRDEYAPGERIVIDSLARRLGVSTTPVREALNYLAAQGLLVFEPHKGFILKKWNKKEIEDLMMLRMCLEKMAIRLFIENGFEKNFEKLKSKVEEMKSCLKNQDIDKMSICNTDFHNIIVKGSGNNELCNVMSSLGKKLYRVRMLSITFSGRFEESFKEHMRIFDAIRKKDVIEAQKAEEEHINNITKTLLRRIK
ncbi:MAG: hypothetical protein DRP55_02805 [Spirochaetes bacterium]|nr:MAG: hypothetical protein DRP55_02805 [Spirochaetota bacterium]